MEGKDKRYPDYPLFRGPRRPLEFMSIQGRCTCWAAGVAGGVVVGFIIAYCLIGFAVGLVVLVMVVSTGITPIMLEQRKGLHTRRDERGVYTYAHSKRPWEERKDHHK